MTNYAENLDADIVYQGYKIVDDVSELVLSEKKVEAAYAMDVESCMALLCDLFEIGDFFA